jgi:hypothetical protein
VSIQVSTRALSLVYIVAIYPVAAINYPSPPAEPSVVQPQSAKVDKTAPGGRKNSQVPKVPLESLRLRIHLGDKSVIVAETQLPESYSFTHSKGKLQYKQTVRADSIREIAIEDYHGHRIASEKDGDVFEFEPARVRIELKDGQVYTLNYLFKDLRKIKAQNSDGTFTVYAFFADTYNPKHGWQERGGHEKTSKTRRTHPAAFARLEYFEPVERAGASDAEKPR